MSTLPLAIAVGDPAGIGPLVTLRALAARPLVRALVHGDARRLQRLVSGNPSPNVSFHDVGAVSDDVALRRGPSEEGGAHQLRALDAAIAAVREGRARALVTGPVSKEAIALGADPKFIGQTEHLARVCGLADDAVTMMFLGPRLRVALVTTHVAVARAPAMITAERVMRTVRHLSQALLSLDPVRAPIVEVAGLNPHLGEHGLFGDEDERVVAPAVAALRLDAPFSTGQIVLRGPRPAEAVLRAAANGEIDGVVAMIHDQATIPSKLLDWGKAVNVTWGLPFLRTSVDHGVAYHAVDADPEGMTAAIDLADRLAR